MKFLIAVIAFALLPSALLSRSARADDEFVCVLDRPQRAPAAVVRHFEMTGEQLLKTPWERFEKDGRILGSDNANVVLSGNLVRISGRNIDDRRSGVRDTSAALSNSDIKLTGNFKTDLANLELGVRVCNDRQLVKNSKWDPNTRFDLNTFLKELYLKAKDAGGVKGLSIELGEFDQAYGLEYMPAGEFNDSLFINQVTNRRWGAEASFESASQLKLEVSAFQARRGFDRGPEHVDSMAFRLSKTLTLDQGGTLGGEISGMYLGNKHDLALVPEKRLSAGIKYTTRSGKTKVWAEGVITDSKTTFKGEHIAFTAGIDQKICHAVRATISGCFAGDGQVMAGVDVYVLPHLTVGGNFIYERYNDKREERTVDVVVSVPIKRNPEAIFFESAHP